MGVQNYSSITMKFNGEAKSKSYGWSETWNFLSEDPNNIITKGRFLSLLRANMLPTDCFIVSCIGRDTARKNFTFNVNPEPLQGNYLPAAEKHVMAANATVSNMTVGNGTGSITPPVISDPTVMFAVEHPKIAAFFRIESNAQDRSIRALHAIPGFWIDDDAPNGLEEGHTWFNDGGPIPTTVPAPNRNYWTNFTPFFDYVTNSCQLIRKNAVYDPAAVSGPTFGRWVANAIKKVFFQKIDDMVVGKPFNLEVGRHY